MLSWDLFLTNVRLWMPVLGVAVLILIGLRGLHWWLLKRDPSLKSEEKIPRQLTVLGVAVTGIVAIVLLLPAETSTRNQLLALIGFLISAIIGLASTTLVANAMANVMLRITNSIRTGDFLRVSGHFGRVTQRGLLHTEIQTEARDLTTLPNSFLISNPYTVIRSSGTIVSTTLSLGYDVAVAQVEPLLLEAAIQVGLTEPFVMVLELGNYSITYRISGFLSEIKQLLSVHSDLCKSVIRTLHGAGVEIVSPTFMNQRQLAAGVRIIPEPVAEAVDSKPQPPPEELMFDKADESEEIERASEQLHFELKSLKEQVQQAEGEERTRLQEQIEERKAQLSELSTGDSTSAAS